MQNSDHLIDDRRLQLASDNVFRRCAQNGMPDMPEGVTASITIKTAAELQKERMSKKRA